MFFERKGKMAKRRSTYVPVRAFARKSDPETSHDAADSVRNLTELQKVIQQILTLNKLTDEELVEFWPKIESQNPWLPKASPQSIRSRRKELVGKGLVFATRERRITKYGRKAIVWSADLYEMELENEE
jgi:hypothetical protein